MLLVLTGAGISLVTSVVVTWVQGRQARKGENRVAARESTRELTGLFIAEREGAAENGGTEPTPALAEAEMMSVAITDRRTRERMRAVIRLLRELRLPELQELSGANPAVLRPLLCDHALEVLGSHFRNERLPALPQSVQKMLDVEDEALNIHAGGAPRNVASAIKTSDATAGTGAGADAGSARPSGSSGKSSPAKGSGSSSKGSGSSSKGAGASSAGTSGSATDSGEAPAPRGRIRRKQGSGEESDASARRSKTDKGADADAEEHTSFWKDDDA
ncbi:hypothetical protein [Streptomonospora salina]|uniref:Uncharacterized protein n=1 Tax=Streptomonospora salina TaxID=104205 RepID=A0A841EB91_9ACTN|nr:hypothetical protein [Streptomonospora salina]MBB5998599.1 hypothetical protein [Streptomonospora salina]